VIDETVDVVLLDRMMPGMSGQEVLAAIRERGLDCRVAMVTAVDADFDVIEMGFDEYLGKPRTETNSKRRSNGCPNERPSKTTCRSTTR